MTSWDYFSELTGLLSPLVVAAVVLAAVIVFIVGFAKRGATFLKYGFGKTELDDSLAKRFDELKASMATKDDIARLDEKIALIEVNHFGHLKNYLGILNGVLLDKGIVNNENKARLDTALRGM
jgi:hypothetical protein